jgi:hypothetical protein
VVTLNGCLGVKRQFDDCIQPDDNIILDAVVQRNGAA